MKTNDIISILQFVIEMEGIKEVNAITVCDERLLIYRNNMVLQAPLIMVKNDFEKIALFKQIYRDFNKAQEK